jgi:enamine deaminase RidA (YjgF/YER057c/UK114 family)
VTGRTNLPSGSSWGDPVGYSRAVRVGDHVFVAGTTAVDHEGRVVGDGDWYQQARFALARVVAALEQLGAGPGDVVRTRLFVTDIAHWEDVGRAHAEVFGEVRPACTMVEVARLIDPALLVEVEAEAVVSDTPGHGAGA